MTIRRYASEQPLPYDWKMPADVEELIGLLNTYGGTCYFEHAELIRAFFNKPLTYPGPGHKES